MAAQEVISMVIGTAQVTVLIGVFFKLGGVTEGLKALGERVLKLEQKGS